MKSAGGAISGAEYAAQARPWAGQWSFARVANTDEAQATANFLSD
jgi:hypothetical protein